MNLKQMHALLPELVKAEAESEGKLTNPRVTEQHINLDADTEVTSFTFGTYYSKTILLIDSQGELVYRAARTKSPDFY